MKHSSVIGVFDSGLGGLSVLRDIQRLMPAENLLYVADSAHAPYGDKSEAEVVQRSLQITEFFQQQKAKAVVVACNTATAAAVREIRQRYTFPVVGIEPGVKPALLQSQTGRVGVIGTTRTINSEKFSNLLTACADLGQVYSQACPGLVDAVEQGRQDTQDVADLLYHYINPLLEKGIDQLVLGCTHYPFLRPQIEAICGEQVTIVDTGEAVARQLQRLLQHDNLLNTTGGGGMVRFYSSSTHGNAASLISALLKRPVVNVEPLPL